MKKLLLVGLLCGFAALPAAAQNTANASGATKGELLFDAGGRRLAPVYRVTDDGSVQIIIEDKMVTVPGSTISNAGGKLTTSLTKPQVVELH